MQRHDHNGTCPPALTAPEFSGPQVTVSTTIAPLALTYRQAGDALGVCERTVWQLVKDGHLRAAMIGRSVRIPVAELQAYLARQVGR
jgi:excisionase family DNA binding protein